MEDQAPKSASGSPATTKLSLGEIFADAERARRLLDALADDPAVASEFEALEPVLLEAVAGSADPDRALINFERYCAAGPNRLSLYTSLAKEPALARRLLRVLGYSQLLADILVRSPQLVEILLPGEISPPSYPEMLGGARRATSPFQTRPGRLDGLRRFKRRELFRIAVADLFGEADFSTTVQALSDLADACLEEAVRIGMEELGLRPRLAVISLGKLGGGELNYSSDIDVMFLCADEEGDAHDLDRCQTLARSILSALGDATAEGFVFRCDTRLRPEGRSGALVRTVTSALTYYEERGRPWERLALIRARPSAGDREVGDQFLREIQSFVYSRRMGTEDIRALQRIKEQLEDKTRAAGQWETHVKQGMGAIRDVEFAVQLLQLIFGAEHRQVREGHCVRAIEALRAVGALTEEEAPALADGYVFMRRVEHALQIVHELPEQSLPTTPEALNALALRRSFSDGEAFLSTYRRWAERIRTIFLRLFYGPVHKADGYLSPVQQVARGSREARSQAGERLKALGFARSSRALEVLAELGEGEDPEDPVTPERWAVIAERVVEACAASGEPDSALERFRLLSPLVGRRRSLYWFLSDHPEAIELLGQLCGKSPYLTEVLARRTELLDPLFEPGALTDPKSSSVMARELEERLAYEKTRSGRLRAIRRYREREALRIGLRDLSGKALLLETMLELSGLAEICLAPVLSLAVETVEERMGPRPDGGFAILGMGKLGGGEIHYRSDLDVVFVTRSDRAEDLLFWERVAGEWMNLMNEPGPDGYIYKVDARLRPEGKSAQLVRNLQGFQRYFAERAALWERLAATRVRPVAGSWEVGQDAVRIFHGFATLGPLTEADRAEIARIKERIERERNRARGDELDLKLSPGGILELEFIVQALQIHYGGEGPAACLSSTHEALDNLRRRGLLSGGVGEALEESYRLLRNLEFRLQIASERGSEVIDRNPESWERLAARCSPMEGRHWEGGDLEAAVGAAMGSTRRIFSLFVESGLDALRLAQTL